MKAAGLDEIFNQAKTSVVEAVNDQNSFWNIATVKVQDESSDDELKAFEQAEKPQQKTRQQVIREGIDRSPMLSVAEIKAKFNKGGNPVFPKQVFVGGKKLHATESGELISPPRSPTIEERAQHIEVSTPEPTQGSGRVTPPTDQALLTREEFSKIAEVHGCLEPTRYFSSPRPIEVIIKPEAIGTRTEILIKQMQLQFNEDQRLLVMIRKNATRFIRLNDVVRLDGREECLLFLKDDNIPNETRMKKPIALFFTTTLHPMIIMTNSDEEKEMLIKLIIFLRELLKTDSTFEICA